MSTSAAAENPPEQSTGSDSSPGREPWLEHMEKEMEPDALDEEVDVLKTMRAMLLAPDDDKAAAARATQEVQTFYHANYFDEYMPWQRQRDRGVPGLLQCICTYAFELASRLSITDARHGRLADFLTGFKRTAPQEFDPEDPQLLYDNGGAIAEVARDAWNCDHTMSIGRLDDDGQIRKECNRWVSTSAFLAKLIAAEMLDANQVGRAAIDLKEALEAAPDDRYITHLIRTCRAAVASQYILLAGQVMVGELKSPSPRRVVATLDADKWKIWADRLGEIASQAPDDAEWGLKDAAGRARARMVELHPELFEQD